VEKKTLFVDVILPLAIPNLLTYRVPVELNEHVVVGQRVIVQLGKSKLYTAIIRTIHEVAPSNYIAKYLEALLDEGAIVNEIQLKLWEWMSKYYMCNIGEVMSAALPSSLKLASETRLVLDDRWDGDLSDVDHRAEIIVEALQIQENLTLEEAAGILDVKNVRPVVKKLIELGIISTEEALPS
jgi:primosomal protein N' (replication factor Y)